MCKCFTHILEYIRCVVVCEPNRIAHPILYFCLPVVVGTVVQQYMLFSFLFIHFCLFDLFLPLRFSYRKFVLEVMRWIFSMWFLIRVFFLYHFLLFFLSSHLISSFGYCCCRCCCCYLCLIR